MSQSGDFDFLSSSAGSSSRASYKKPKKKPPPTGLYVGICLAVIAVGGGGAMLVLHQQTSPKPTAEKKAASTEKKSGNTLSAKQPTSVPFRLGISEDDRKKICWEASEGAYSAENVAKIAEKYGIPMEQVYEIIEAGKERWRQPYTGKLTSENFLRIKVGDLEDDVILLLGPNHKVNSEHTRPATREITDEYHTKTLAWQEGSRLILITFESRDITAPMRVTNKSQTGL